ncbi:P-loop containing nucleoside triphosphate hydrolase protein [Mariannaea sp. PMI_226]|nr:P-loop containing nucleoside triphosphate hydrolase protein [Mariannaea sp. PMI_226]
MSQLGWYVRQIQTQTVWLTATLPPEFEKPFMQHNKLVRPRVVRESTNRPNIRYIVRREKGLGTLCERAVGIVRSCWTRKDLFKSSRDKIIIYCPTKELVTKLSGQLGCPSYHGDSGTEEEKAAIIQQWLLATDQPAIVATSALGPGFDYPHVRWVIHVGAPDLMTDFSQESGRAGRDGEVAESIILLSATWEPQISQQLDSDRESMQLYLAQKHCSRGVLSQFLDTRPDWRWCMDGDELCGVCPSHYTKSRPIDLQFHLPQPKLREGEPEERESDKIVVDMEFTGPGEVLRQDRIGDEELSRYERDLETMLGCCLYCRIERRQFEHTATACSRRHNWIRAKQSALNACKSQNKEWMAKYAVCWKCYQPQEICRAADPEVIGKRICRFPDMVIPLCYGAFYRPGRTKWFLGHFKRTFNTCHEYMLWLGEPGLLGTSKCVQANCVAALLLAELG